MLGTGYHEIKNAIYEEINNILLENNLEMKSVNDECRFNADLGFGSLDLARLVALVEVRLNADPFLELVSITSIRSVTDLINAYRYYFNNSSQNVCQKELIELRKKIEAR